MTLKRVYNVLFALFAFGLLIAGPVAIAVGTQGLNQVHSNLAQEHITVSKDAAKAYAGKPVTNGATAQAEADVIWHHMMTASHGQTYAQVDKADPVRAQLLTGDSLRSALLSAVLAEKIAYLVIGIGVLLSATGLLLGLNFVVRRREA